MSEIVLKNSGNDLIACINGEDKLVTEISDLPEEQGRDLCRKLAEHFTFMPGSNKNPIQLPRLFLKQPVVNKVVFYGGAFNPWHKGHRICLDLCPSTGIVVVPDTNPWKAGEKREASWSQYIELCRELENTPYSVYPGLLADEKPNPTISWLPQVKAKEKGIIIGDDNFLAFDKWQEYDRLLQNLNQLYVVPRQGHDSELNDQKQKLQQLNPELNIIFLPHHDYEAYSSTWARENKK